MESRFLSGFLLYASCCFPVRYGTKATVVIFMFVSSQLRTGVTNLKKVSSLQRNRTRATGNTHFSCFAAGGFASGIGVGSTGDVVPRSSDAAAQSPAQSLVPLTVPTSLHPIGAAGFACFSLPRVLGVTV